MPLLLLVTSAEAQDFEQGRQAYKRGDYAAALQELHSLAEQGDAHAQSYLGFKYELCFGLPQDYVEAEKWHRKAADKGAAAARFRAGSPLINDKDDAVTRREL